MPLKVISVTHNIICQSDGTRGRDCMVYNALKPHVRKGCNYSVGIFDVIFYADDGKVKTRVWLPAVVSNIVTAHFDGEPIAPFEFPLEIPEEFAA